MITIDIPVEILFIISERKQKIVEEKFVFIAELAPREVAAMINSNFTKPVQQKYKWSLISKQELQVLLKPIRGDAYKMRTICLYSILTIIISKIFFYFYT